MVVLNTELQHYRALKERLVQEFPLLDDETIRDTLEGVTDLHEMIDDCDPLGARG